MLHAEILTTISNIVSIYDFDEETFGDEDIPLA